MGGVIKRQANESVNQMREVTSLKDSNIQHMSGGVILWLGLSYIRLQTSIETVLIIAYAMLRMIIVKKPFSFNLS